MVSLPESTTLTIGKRTRKHHWILAEGGANMPDQSSKQLDCGYCGKRGHYKEDFQKKKRESASTSRLLTNYATNFDYDAHGGMFVMRHKTHLMLASSSINTSSSDNVLFLDTGASNQMTSQKDWFQELRKLDRPGYVEIGDDTVHPIQHVGIVPFDNDNTHYFLFMVFRDHFGMCFEAFPKCGRIGER